MTTPIQVPDAIKNNSRVQIMNPTQYLKALHLEDNRRRFPSLPECARVAPRYTSKDANGLTRMIIDFIRLKGGQAERINNTGRPIDRRQQVVDAIGRVRSIGTMQWIPGTGTKGTSDIHALLNGKSLHIEIKINRDRQSNSQKAYQKAVEQAGGIYYIARSFDEFFNWYQKNFK